MNFNLMHDMCVLCVFKGYSVYSYSKNEKQTQNCNFINISHVKHKIKINTKFNFISYLLIKKNNLMI